MKILMLSGDRSLAAGKRGAFYYTLEELRRYCERIDVLCPRNPKFKIQKSKEIQNPKSQKIFDKVYVHPGEASKLKQIFYLAKRGKELWDMHHHDIVLIHEYPPFYNSLGARLLARKIHPVKSPLSRGAPQDAGQFNRVKFVVEIHHIIGYPRPADFKEKFHFWLSKIMIPRDCKKFDAVRVVNKKQVPDFLRKLGVNEEKLHYASSMYIDLDVFRPVNLDKKYDLVFAGRLVKNKNIGMLIEAIRIVRCKMLDVRCVIVGDGPEGESLKSKVKSLKLDANVEFLGWLPSIEDVARVYNESKLFVMPSLNEGGPRVCLEAMACGLPVVTTRVGIMIDIIRDRENGVFCDWSAEDMADKIIKIQEYKDIKINDNARKTAERFERRSMIRGLAEVYKKIVSL